MSRPSTTAPDGGTAARCTAVSRRRTAGCAAIRDAVRVTASVRSSSPTASPSSRTTIAVGDVALISMRVVSSRRSTTPASSGSIAARNTLSAAAR